MNTSKACVWGLLGIGLSAATAWGQGFSLVPVSASGSHQVAGDQIFLDTPGQRVVLEIRIFGWDPDLDGTPQLKSWQTVLDSSGYSSGLRGTLGPAVQSCTTTSDCTAALGNGSLCDQAGGTLCGAGFIDTARPDFVYASPAFALPAVDLSTLDYRWGAVVLSAPVPDDGTAKYAGTLVVDVPADAMGTFTLGLKVESSQMLDENSALILPLTTFPARITIRCQSDTDCDDGSACTADSCDANGECVNTPLFDPATQCCDPVSGMVQTIDDGNDCTTDVCDAATGNVTHDPLPAGTACGDPTQTECNGADTCDGAGTCQANLAPAGTACGDPTQTECNGADTCDGAGTCQPNFAPAGTACGDPSSTACTAPDACDGSGTCLPNDAPDGTPCDDGLFCNEGETCLGGVCTGGTPVNCDDGIPCTTDTCNETTDQCDNTLDPGFCFIAGECFADGTLNPMNDCEACDPMTATDAWSFRPAGSACDDGDACTGTGRPGIGIDTCDGAGVCSGTPDPECNDDCAFAVPVTEGVNLGNNVNRGPDDAEASCQPDSNNDVWFVYTASCTTTVFASTTGSVFTPSNDPVLSVYDACPNQGGMEIACDDDSGVDLQAALLFNTTAGTSYWIRVAGFENNAGSIVLNIETFTDCLIDGVCYPAGAVNPANGCEACLPDVSTSAWTPLPEGTACGDPSDTECDAPDACNGAGVCESNPKPDGTPCSDEGNECTFDVCSAGACTHPPKPIDTPCGDPSDSECDHPDSCDGAGLCRNNFEPQGVPCGDPSSDQCDLADICDGAGSCDANLVADGTPCDDGDICTGDDACQGGT
ncbi:MAG: hypothetical protein D6788_01805, partial [Planctomycetota bacterium]